MIHIKGFKFLLSMIVALSLALSSLSAQAIVVDKVIVVVNDEVITQREFDRIFTPIKRQYEATFEGDELQAKLDIARKGVLEELISSKLITSLAKQEEIEIDEEQFQADIDKVIAYYRSEEEFLQELSAKGTNLTEFKREMREQALAQKFVEKEVASKIVVTPGEIREVYEKNKDKFMTSKQVRARGIMIRKKEGPATDKSRQEIEVIVTQIKSGEDFATLAKEFSEGPYASEGGDMGFVTQGEMLKEIDETIFSLKEGELSGIIETPIGYHLFLVEEIQEERPMRFSEVNNFIKDQLFMRKFSEALTRWVEEKRKHAYISYK